jgi:tRNA pseudouridine38-40 synthase
VEKENIPPEKFAKALNVYLPSDIRVIKSERALEDFHAVKSAVKKTYCYSFYKSDVELPLKERFAVRIDCAVDVEKMRAVSKAFIGEHDFKALCSSGSSAKTTIRTIYNVDIVEKDDDIKVFVTGNGFLYNMVRILCGTLLMAGEDKLDLITAEKMLSTGDRTLGGRTCVAKGLCLISVEYADK